MEPQRGTMPVNMDPTKKRRHSERATEPTAQEGRSSPTASPPLYPSLGMETPEDREKELADAELKNLWDATEVIDMDTV
jgi:hypothetical protein